MLELDPQGDNERRHVPVNNIKQIVFAGPRNKVKIGTQFLKEKDQALIQVLSSNVDLFACGLGDIPGIDIEVACH